MKTDAERLRDEAIERVQRSLTDRERWAALGAVGRAAERLPVLTTDDVEFDFPPNVDLRVVGAIMSEAARVGLIEKTDDYRKSIESDCHARPKRVWHSELYGKE